MTLCNIINGNQYLEEPAAPIFPIDHVFQEMEEVNRKNIYMNSIYSYIILSFSDRIASNNIVHMLNSTE
jgi:hypothetical protein